MVSTNNIIHFYIWSSFTEISFTRLGKILLNSLSLIAACHPNIVPKKLEAHFRYKRQFLLGSFAAYYLSWYNDVFLQILHTALQVWNSFLAQLYSIKPEPN